jgi:hypothetical protein
MRYVAEARPAEAAFARTVANTLLRCNNAAVRVPYRLESRVRARHRDSGVTDVNHQVELGTALRALGSIGVLAACVAFVGAATNLWEPRTGSLAALIGTSLAIAAAVARFLLPHDPLERPW